MKKAALSADLIQTASKGGAAPTSLSVVPASPKPEKPDEGPLVGHSFRVSKAFKRAFDRAAFDEDMTGKDYLEMIHRFYQEHKGQV